MKVVGRRQARRVDWEEIAQLLETVAALRPTDRLVPRGVYRFATFEEADLWMTKTIARTLVRLGSTTSSSSAAR